MKFRVTLQSNDYYQFYVKNYQKIEPRIYQKNQMRVYGLLMIVCSTIAIFFLYKMFREYHIELLNYVLIALICLIITLIFYVVSYLKYYIDCIAEDSKIIVGEKEIELNAQYIIESTELYSLKTDWELVSIIEKTEKHLFIFLGLGVGIILPLDQITSEIEQKIKDYCPHIPFTLCKKKFNQ